MKILNIDDHVLIRDGVALIVQELAEDIQYLPASCYAEAEQLAIQHPDIELVLLDISLPDVSGFDILEKLTVQLPTVSVIILSGSESSADITRAMNASAQGYIPKSYSKDLMLSAIRLVLSGGIFIPPSVFQNNQLEMPKNTLLTQRQQAVLNLLSEGKSNKIIARDLNMAVNTVGVHVMAIFKILGVNNRTEAAHQAIKMNLV
jgi:DNA-binding NarL/FixJ family response regulator